MPNHSDCTSAPNGELAVANSVLAIGYSNLANKLKIWEVTEEYSQQLKVWEELKE